MERISLSAIYQDHSGKHWRVVKLLENDEILVGPCNKNGRFPHSWNEVKRNRTVFLASHRIEAYASI